MTDSTTTSDSDSLAALTDEQRDALMAAAPNFRDAGGLATPSGRLKQSVLWRTGQLAGLAEPAQDALTTLGVTDVVDLRTAAERDPKPDTLPASATLRVADVLADAPTSGAATLASLVGAGHAQDPPPSIDDINALISNGRAEQMMIETYRDFLRLPSANTAYREFLITVVESRGAVAFHCTAGKDRTGWAAAIVQMFAGVNEDAVVKNYLESSPRTMKEFAPLLQAFASVGGDAESLNALVDVKSEYLTTAMEAMHSTYGSVEAYFRDGLKLTDSHLEGLHTKVTE